MEKKKTHIKSSLLKMTCLVLRPWQSKLCFVGAKSLYMDASQNSVTFIAFEIRKDTINNKKSTTIRNNNHEQASIHQMRGKKVINNKI